MMTARQPARGTSPDSFSDGCPSFFYCRLSRTMTLDTRRKSLDIHPRSCSGDVPRAGWRAVIISEVIFPIIMAVLFIIAYMFVKIIPGQQWEATTRTFDPHSVIALGPLVWNAAVLLVLFMTSLFLGPILDPRYPCLVQSWLSLHISLPSSAWLVFFEFLVSFSIRCLHHHLNRLCAVGSLNCGTPRTPF